MHISATIVHSWSSHFKNAQLQKYTVFFELAVSSPTLIIRLVTTIFLRFQVGFILIISTRRNAYVTVTVTLAGTYVYKLVVWVACSNKDYVLKLLGCVVSFFVGVSNLSHVEPNFTFDVHFILYDNC